MSKIQQLQEIIDTSDNIVFFGGAGVSTESGIPDFRSESGIFESLEKYGDTPENLISHSDRPTFSLLNMNEKFYQMPSYLRRSAINTATGCYSSYYSNLKIRDLL